MKVGWRGCEGIRRPGGERRKEVGRGDVGVAGRAVKEEGREKRKKRGGGWMSGGKGYKGGGKEEERS